MTTRLPILTSFALAFSFAIYAVISCSGDPPDKQTSDIVSGFQVTLPDDPCSKARAADSIRVKFFTLSTASGAQMYIAAKLTNVKGSTYGDICCQPEVYTDAPSQLIVRYFYPPEDMPNGVYEVTIGITSDSDVAKFCAVDGWRLLHAVTDANYIRATDCGTRLEVYYDCQSSYDIRYGDDLIHRLNSSFGEEPAYDTLLLRVGSTSTTIETLVDNRRLIDYVEEHWQSVFDQQLDSVDICLLAVEDINRSNFPAFLLKAAGFSSGYDFTADGLGKRGAWSMAFVKYIKTLPWDSKYDEPLLLRNATHELGHARAHLTHPSESPALHELGFMCVMDTLDIKVPGTNYPYTSEYNRFCGDCRRNISFMLWPE